VIIKYRKILNLIKLIQYNKYRKNYLTAKIENNCHCHSDELIYKKELCENNLLRNYHKH